MKYLPILGGLVLIVYSIISLVQIHARGPVDVTIEQLEKGEFPEGEYVRVTGGWAVYGGVYEERVAGSGSITYFCHPLFSEDNEVFDRLDALAGQYGSVEAIPDSEMPELHTFKVLVKTERYAELDDIPDLEERIVVTGAVSDSVGFDSEMRSEFRKTFPEVNPDDLIMVEENKLPGMPIRVLGIIGGVSMIVVGIVIVAKGRPRPYRPVPWQQPSYQPQAYPQQQPYPPGPQGPSPPQREGEAPPPDFSS
ncbi:MAG: hypothetical protein ABIH04_10165 [Planctomycetota bacterium]